VKYAMKKALAMLISCCMIVNLFGMTVFADEKQSSTVEELSGFEYTLDEEEKIVILTKYTDSNATVKIEDTYVVEGIECDTIIDSESIFKGNTKIKDVTMEGDIGFVDDSMKDLFYNCSKLEKVDLSNLNTSGVTDMSFLFYQCEMLKEIDLENLDTANVTNMKSMFNKCKRLEDLKGYQELDTGAVKSIYHMFNYVQSSITDAEKKWVIDLSNWDLSQVNNSGWCFQQCQAKGIVLPDSLPVMSAGFLNHALNHAASDVGASFTIPSGVKKIGYGHTIYDFGTNEFVEFEVAEGNTSYKAVDDILYSADGRELIAVPRNKTFEDDMFVIPEGVEFIPELCFSRNNNFHTLVLPNTMKFRQHVPVYDPQYEIYEDGGNLNEGNTLTIALYLYTSVTDYATKEDNPNYKAVDGILYNRDMTELVAVPARYEKPMEIPEGVTDWNTFAMWADGSVTVDQYMILCPGVTIPASMTYIAQDQMDMLNRLNKYRLNGTKRTIHLNITEKITGTYTFRFEITVDENNPVFSVDENGYLIADGIAEQGVILEKETFTYDGAPHEPAVTVTCNGKLLEEGTDYTIEYLNNIFSGTATVKITAQGDYRGVVEKNFVIQSAEQEEDPGEPEETPEPNEPTIPGDTGKPTVPNPPTDVTNPIKPTDRPNESEDSGGGGGGDSASGTSKLGHKVQNQKTGWISDNMASGKTQWKYYLANEQPAAGVLVKKEDGSTYEQPHWELINNAWYAFGADGYTEEGWVYDTELDGWFYIDINVGMKTGWQLIDGVWYYLQTVSDGKKGIMYADQWIDGWYVDANGAWDGKEQVKMIE